MYFGNNRILVKTVHGFRMFLDTRDIVISPIIALEGEWEPELTRYFLKTVKPGMRVIDVGANMGYFSLICAGILKNTNGFLYSYEADPECHEFLVDNLALNWYFDEVSATNLAIYSKEDDLVLNVRDKYKGNTSIGDVDAKDLSEICDGIRKVNVHAMPLDLLHKDNQQIDFIKIDVEGAELYVLQGAKEIIRKSENIKVLVEWSPGQMHQVGYEPLELLEFINELGFQSIKVVEENSAIRTNEYLLNELGHGTLLLER